MCVQVRECSSKRGFWIIDHLKSFNHHPPQFHSPSMQCYRHCTIFLTLNHSVTVSSTHTLSAPSCFAFIQLHTLKQTSAQGLLPFCYQPFKHIHSAVFLLPEHLTTDEIRFNFIVTANRKYQHNKCSLVSHQIVQTVAKVYLEMYKDKCTEVHKNTPMFLCQQPRCKQSLSANKNNIL